MANITFSSPQLGKDVTVYAVAGDRGTILAVAKEHRIPIPFDCQDGECGSCLVEVNHLNPSARYGIALTEKEKEMLRQLGKITRQEIEDAEVRDMPPRYRLACQCFVRNEDILVSFEGDTTLPKPTPHITAAAKIFRGGIRIQSLDEFLSYAIKIEQDAALHFENLASSLGDAGNEEVATLFSQLAYYSRLHLKKAQERATRQDVTVELPPDYVWPDHVTPERTSLLAADPKMKRIDGLRAALQGEKRGYEFYLSVTGTATDPAVIEAAREFVREEAEHVRVLEGWLAREEWLTKNHQELKAG